jgi:hypothetical protein
MLELKEIIGYLPYGLEVRYQGEIVKVEGIIHNDIYNSDTGEIPLHCVKPILTHIEDMSKEQLEQMYFIHSENRFQFHKQASELSYFFHSNKIDIYNLIERNLAIDIKTIK